MRYDALAQSLELLGGAPPATDVHLSRRIRLLPLAVDRDGDIAATMFLRRGVSGQPVVDVHSLESTATGWRLLGGGSGPEDRVTEPRPALAVLGSPAESHGGGGTARTEHALLSRRRSNWLSWMELRAAREVAVLRVDGRHLAVADHGMAVVVWSGRPPVIEALDISGTVLGPVVP